MAVIAKFYVSRIANVQTPKTSWGPGGTVYQVALAPVSSGSEENKMFFKWSPSGEIQLTTPSLEFAETFKGGGEFYVTFEHVESVQPEIKDPIFRVTKMGNESGSVEDKCFHIELVGAGNGHDWGSTIKIGTINESAARDFLSFGKFRVRFTPAPPATA